MVSEQTRLEQEAGRRLIWKGMKLDYIDALKHANKISVFRINAIDIRVVLNGTDKFTYIDDNYKEFPTDGLIAKLRLLFG